MKRRASRTARWPAYRRIPSFTPVPVRARRDGWTPERQARFLGWLAQTGCVAKAAAKLDMARETAYRLRRREGAGSFAHVGCGDDHPRRRGSAPAEGHTG